MKPEPTRVPVKGARARADTEPEFPVFVRVVLTHATDPHKAFAAILNDCTQGIGDSPNPAEWSFTHERVVFTITAKSAR